MTWDDVYVTVTILAFVGLVAVAVGWAIDCWPEWSAAHKRAVDSHRTLAALRFDSWPPLPGTVHNPTDPSPVPRLPKG